MGGLVLSFFKNLCGSQFVVIHTVKGFNAVNEAEVDVSLKFPCFLYNPADVGNLISLLFHFLNSAWTSEVLGSHNAEA